MTQEETNEQPQSEKPKRHHVRVAGRRMRIPASRSARIAIGVSMVILGCFGFLPILGFWMVPVGLLILSHDMPSIRRRRRLMEVWWYRRKQAKAKRNGQELPK